jgi:RimJ/RimL family protein N-acetyltransferase
MTGFKKVLPIEQIKTDRLILRQWKSSDLAPFAKLNADSRVREFFPSTLSCEESDASAETISQNIEKNGWGFWAVSCPGVSDFIGMVGLSEVKCAAPFVPAVEIGWRLAHEQWGKGYATEAARAAAAFGFSTLDLEEIVAFTTLQNDRSRHVMKKIGMKHTPADDFEHPLVPEGDPLRKHVLYRLNPSLFYQN